MSLLHSFYCWGSVGVILLSTAFFAIFGIEHWKILACLWAFSSGLYNTFNFLTCPIESLTEEGEGLTIHQLCGIPVFWIALILMVCAGASEISMAQWARCRICPWPFQKSGDIAGPCLFAVMMGICRSFYGKYGEKIDLSKFMIASGTLCLICYLLAALALNPLLNLSPGCVVCGFSVGIMWPGTISITSGKIPLGGTAMFASLANGRRSRIPSTVYRRHRHHKNSGDNLKAGYSGRLCFPSYPDLLCHYAQTQKGRNLQQPEADASDC